MNIQKLITLKIWAVAILVTAIGAVALYTSYEALYQTALTNGYTGLRATLWPALIDAPLVVFTLAVLVAQLTRQDVKLWAALVVVYTLATIGFNLAHATPTALGYAVATAAPLGLLLTTEALRHLAKVQIEQMTAIQSLADLTRRRDKTAAECSTLTATRDNLTAQIEEAEATLGDIQADIATAQNEAHQATNQVTNGGNVAEMNAAKEAKIEERRSQVLEMVNAGMLQKDIAAELDVSAATIRRDIKALNGSVQK